MVLSTKHGDKVRVAGADIEGVFYAGAETNTAVALYHDEGCRSFIKWESKRNLTKIIPRCKPDKQDAMEECFNLLAADAGYRAKCYLNDYLHAEWEGDKA